MRVAKYYNNRDVRIEDLPVPAIGAEEILVKVVASGICGSDVMEWYRIKKAPLVLGHEIAGVISKVGEKVKNFQVGQRVFVSHHVPCGACHYCRSGNETVCDTLLSTNFDPGGFAEYIRVPALQVKVGTFLIPEELTYDEGTFIEPLGCVIRGQRRAGFQPGQSVLVLGSGLAGILHIALAKALGAGKILATDIHPYRLQLAEKFGAARAIDAKDKVAEIVKKETDGRGADLVIIAAAGVPIFDQALASACKGGTILLFAPTSPEIKWSLPVFDLWRCGLNLIPSYGAAPRDLEAAIELLKAKKVPVVEMITHRLPLSQAALGFKLTAEAGESLKVILEPGK